MYFWEDAYPADTEGWLHTEGSMEEVPRRFLICVSLETFSTRLNQLFKDSAQSWPADTLLTHAILSAILGTHLFTQHTSDWNVLSLSLNVWLVPRFLSPYASLSLHPPVILSLPSHHIPQTTCHGGSSIRGCHCRLISLHLH